MGSGVSAASLFRLLVVGCLVAASMALAAPAEALTEEDRLIADPPGPGDQFGFAVAIDGDTAVIGAPLNDDVGTDAGAAYVYQRTGTDWIQVATLIGADTAAGDSLGYSVAISGNTIAVGAPTYDANGPNVSGDNYGAVYVFVDAGAGWVEEAKLSASDAAPGDQFGYSVAIDADTLAVGAPFNGGAISQIGTAYVFERDSGTWLQELWANGVFDGRFGTSVDVDDNTLVVGAPGANDTYVVPQIIGWVAIDGEPATPNPSDMDDIDEMYTGCYWECTYINESDEEVDAKRPFGTRCCLPWPLDTTRYPVGILDPVWGFGFEISEAVGAAYVYERSASGWTSDRTRIEGATGTEFPNAGDYEYCNFDFTTYPGGPSFFDDLPHTPICATSVLEGGKFGDSVAVSGDRIVVGAPLTGYLAGAAFMFSRTSGFGTSAWTNESQWGFPYGRYLWAVRGSSGDQFGGSVAIDGDTVVVGAHESNANGAASGSAHVYEASVFGTWSVAETLTASDAAAGTRFGQSVGIADDRALVGAHRANSASVPPIAFASGAAYVFSLSDNTAPTADAAGPYGGDEGAGIPMGSATAADSDGDALTYLWSVDSALCTFDDASALQPTVTCTDEGAYTATLTVNDNVNPSVTSTAAVTVDNAPPVADDDSLTVGEDDGPSTVTATLLDGDSDPGTGDVLSVSGVETTTTAGTVSLDAGSVSYDPAGSFEALAVGESATDTFSYTLSDGDGGTATATVTVTVTGANDTPTADDDSVSVTEDDGALDVTGVLLAGDLDPDGSDLLATTALDTSGTVGVAALNGSAVTYDPNGQFEGLATGESATDSFGYTVSDNNGGTATAAVTVTITGVNDAPLATDDVDATDEDTSLITVNVLDNDTDVDDSDVLVVASIDTIGTQGLVVDNGDGTFTYDPNGQFEELAVGESTIDGFDYTVSDGNGGTDTAAVTVTITGVNDAAIATDDVDATDEDTSLITVNVLDNDTDVDDSDVLAVTSIDTSGTQGLVVDNGDGTFTYDPNGQFEELAVGESTMDGFDYTVSDGNGGQATASVTISITGVNDRPTADDDSIEVAEDAGTTDVTEVLLDGDLDPDATDVLSITAINSSGTIGAAALNGSTATYGPDGQFDSLAVGETTVDSFDYTVSDGNGGEATATATVTVLGENDAPVVIDDTDETTEDVAFTTVDVLDNDSDPDGSDVLSVTQLDTANTVGLVTNNADGTFFYDPNDQFEGLAVGESATDEFDYTVSDGHFQIIDPGLEPGAFVNPYVGTVTITVTGANDVPVVVDDAGETTEDTAFTTVNVLDNDSDPDGSDVLTVTQLDTVNTVGLVTNNGDGTFFYDPDGQFEGLAVGESATDEFDYTVSDGHFQIIDPGLEPGAFVNPYVGTVTITVTGVNDAPNADDDETSVGEDDGPVDLTALLLDGDADPDVTDVLSASAVDTTGTTGTVTLVGGTVTYDPDGQFEGLADGETAIDSFDYTVSDGNGGTDTATVTITVFGANDAPTATIEPGAMTVQYSDAVAAAISADDVDATSLTVTTSFTVDGGPTETGLPAGLSLTGDCSTVPCSLSLDGVADVAPGEYVVTVTVDDGTEAAEVSTTISVVAEDARAFYVGPLFVSTPSASDGLVDVELRATVQDITAAVLDPATDPYAGDVQNATVEFRDQAGNVLCAAPAVDLIVAGDTSVGTAVCVWQADIGNADAEPFEIHIVVDGYYVDSSDTEVIVTVAKPLDNFITGGGYLVASDSAGVYAAGDGEQVNYGFNVKFNKKGTNLKGKATIIIRTDDGRKYKIKSNALQSLGVVLGPDGEEPHYAEFESKANLTDVTDEENEISLGGNLTLLMQMHDNGEPGDSDTIGISLWDSDGQLLFSSNWTGVQTVEQTIGGGNLQVH